MLYYETIREKEVKQVEDNNRKKAFDYINSYQKEKYDRITIIRPKGEKDKLTEISKQKGYRTLTEFINCCIDEKLKRMKIKL